MGEVLYLAIQLQKEDIGMRKKCLALFVSVIMMIVSLPIVTIATEHAPNDDSIFYYSYIVGDNEYVVVETILWDGNELIEYLSTSNRGQLCDTDEMYLTIQRINDAVSNGEPVYMTTFTVYNYNARQDIFPRLNYVAVSAIRFNTGVDWFVGHVEPMPQGYVGAEARLTSRTNAPMDTQSFPETRFIYTTRRILQLFYCRNLGLHFCQNWGSSHILVRERHHPVRMFVIMRNT